MSNAYNGSMPYGIIPRIIFRKSSPTVAAYWCVLATYADPSSRSVWASQSTIANDIGVSINSIRNYEKEALELGIIKRCEHQNRQSTVFILASDIELEKIQDKPKSKKKPPLKFKGAPQNSGEVEKVDLPRNLDEAPQNSGEVEKVDLPRNLDEAPQKLGRDLPRNLDEPPQNSGDEQTNNRPIEQTNNRPCDLAIADLTPHAKTAEQPSISTISIEQPHEPCDVAAESILNEQATIHSQSESKPLEIDPRDYSEPESESDLERYFLLADLPQNEKNAISQFAGSKNANPDLHVPSQATQVELIPVPNSEKNDLAAPNRKDSAESIFAAYKEILQNRLSLTPTRKKAIQKWLKIEGNDLEKVKQLSRGIKKSEWHMKEKRTDIIYVLRESNEEKFMAIDEEEEDIHYCNPAAQALLIEQEKAAEYWEDIGIRLGGKMQDDEPWDASDVPPEGSRWDCTFPKGTSTTDGIKWPRSKQKHREWFASKMTAYKLVLRDQITDETPHADYVRAVMKNRIRMWKESLEPTIWEKKCWAIHLRKLEKKKKEQEEKADVLAAS